MLTKAILQLTRIAEDEDDGSWHVDLHASNGRYAVSQEFYTLPDAFQPFAAELRRFGSTVRDEAIIEFGRDQPNWAHFVRLRAFIHSPRGEAALEVVAKDHSLAPYASQGNFYIFCEPASINRLGEALQAWLKHPGESLTWHAGA